MLSLHILTSVLAASATIVAPTVPQVVEGLTDLETRSKDLSQIAFDITLEDAAKYVKYEGAFQV